MSAPDALTRTRMAGRGRYLEPGQTALVPRSAVRFGEWSRVVSRSDAALGAAGDETKDETRTEDVEHG